MSALTVIAFFLAAVTFMVGIFAVFNAREVNKRWHARVKKGS